jgi:hypothetical protein
LCEFISWIEKGDEILFLTGNDVFQTKRGLELQKYCKSKSDLTGHGAIRWYFGKDDKPLEAGKERECTNFSTPDNFPKAIAKAIKRGEMWGFEYGTPEQLLWDAAVAEYQKVTDAAYAEYQKVTDAAYAEYQKVTDAAYAEYKKVTDAAFWTIFADKNNRNPKWK